MNYQYLDGDSGIDSVEYLAEALGLGSSAYLGADADEIADCLEAIIEGGAN